MTIKEVSDRYGLSQDTLRYYERIGLIPRVERLPSGYRDYSEQACAWVELAKCMRSAGVSIEALIEYCMLAQKGDATISARKELLAGERRKLLSRIEEMQKTLDRLNYKIERYEIAEKTGVISWDERILKKG